MGEGEVDYVESLMHFSFLPTRAAQLMGEIVKLHFSKFGKWTNLSSKNTFEECVVLANMNLDYLKLFQWIFFCVPLQEQEHVL